MAEKINYSTFFDFSDESQVQAFIQGSQDIIGAYNQILGEAKKNKSDLSKATNQLVKALEEEEKVLQRANDATKAGQETIAKSAANTSKFTAELKKQREEEEKLNKEIADLKKQVDALNASMDKAKAVTDAATKSNKAASGSVDELKQKVVEAKKAYEALGDSVDPIEKSNALENYAKLKQELDKVNKATADAAKGNIIAKGSYNELQREVDELHKEYKNLPDALGKNKVKAEELRKTLGQKRQVLKDLDAQMNLHNRNVGNYSESLKDAAMSSNLFGGKLAQAAQGLQGLQNGLKTASSGFGSLKYAIASTGIGLLLVAFGLLVNLFKNFEPFAELLERAFAGIGAAVNIVSRYLAEFTVNIIKAFSDPQKAMEDFGKSIKEFVLSQIETLLKGVKGLGSAISNLFSGNFKQAAKDAGQAFLDLNSALNPMQIATDLLVDSFKGMAKEMSEAAQAAAELTGRLQDLEDAERVFGVTTVKNRGLVDQLILRSKQQDLATQDRINSLKEAGRIELDETAKAIKLAEEKLDIIVKQNKLNSKLSEDQIKQLTTVDGYLNEVEEKYGKLYVNISGAQLDAQADAQKALQQILNDSLEKQQKIRNREAALNEELLKEINERNKKIAEGMGGKELEKNQALINGKISKSIDDEIKMRADGYNKDLENYKKLQAEKLEEERRHAELRKELQQQTQDLITEAASLPFEIVKQKRQEELSDLQEQRAYELELVGDNAKQKDLINREYDKRERKIKRDIAKADRNKALFDIAINTAVGISKAIPNVPLIIFSAAVGLAQAALVLAKPIPQYERGTKNASEGWAIVDEKGPELRESKGKLYMGSNRGPRLTYLNRGDKIHTAEETQKILEGKTASDMLLSYQLGAYKLSGVKQDPTIDYEKLSRPIVDAINRKPSASLHVDRSGIRAFYRKGNAEIEYLNSKGINI